MLLEKYDSLQGKIFNVLDDDGKVLCPESMPDLPEDKIVQAYKQMVYTRVADTMSVSYQRQGRMYTYPPNLGQEASAVGTAMAMEEEDWLVPAYREIGAYFVRGVTPKDLFLIWRGDESGFKMPGAKNILPICVPIASQLLHAVGIAHALKYKRQKGIVFAYVGDGGTSEGDFHEALNFAGAWHVPVLFICQNNQYAISMPRHKQTASATIAVKSVAYGLKGIQVDGNDFLATYAAATAAAQHLRSGGNAVLMECVTYRKGAHTTSDDPQRYRTQEEEKAWDCKDPLKRLRNYLIAKGLWREEDDVPLQERYSKEIDSHFSQAEREPYALENVFKYNYVEMPDDLHEQHLEYRNYLEWKERQPWR